VSKKTTRIYWQYFICKKIQKKEQAYAPAGTVDNVPAPSSFIANAHNKLYAFYTWKGGFLENKNQNQ